MHLCSRMPNSSCEVWDTDTRTFGDNLPMLSVRSGGRVSGVKKFLRFLADVKEFGIREATTRALAYLKWRSAQAFGKPMPATYDLWVSTYTDLVPSDVHNHDPLISVVMPVYNTPPVLLEAAVASVLSQSHDQLELLLVDDGSSDQSTLSSLNAIAASDFRASVITMGKNSGIVAATNRGVEAAGGEWIVFLDHDDELAPQALRWIASTASEADLVYSDEDKINQSGDRAMPFFKPAWSPRLLLGVNYVNHMTAMRKSLITRVGGLRPGFDGAQDHDLLLRIADIPGVRVVHIPNVLYHWRSWEGSTADAASSKPEAEQAGLRAVAETISRRRWNAHVRLGNGSPFNYRVIFDTSDPRPTVKVVIPTRDKVKLLKQCISGLLDRTDGVDLHIVVIDNGSVKASTMEYFDHLSARTDVTIRRLDDAFNYSRLCNLGADTGPDCDYTLFMNNDVKILHRDWLQQLAGWLQSDDRVVGVGPKMRFPNGNIQHAGVIVGFGGIAGHYSGGQPDQPRLSDLHDQAREVSCLTAAVLLVRSEEFRSVGGFREELPIDFQDVDFCLRLTRDLNGTLVYDPTYPVVHHESASRGTDGAVSGYTVARMRFLWGDVLDRFDPFYSPHLSLWNTDMRLEELPIDSTERFKRIAPRSDSIHV
jgi:GT2 family glycosyltransferase